MNTKRNKNGEKIFKKKRFIPTILFILLNIGLTIYLVINLAKLANVENLLRVIICCILIVISLLFTFTGYKTLNGEKNKGFIFYTIISIIYLIILGFINFNFQYIYNSINKTNTNLKTYTLSLVTLKDNEITNIEDIDNDRIGVINDREIANGYNLAESILNKFYLDNELEEYETYLEIIDALYNDRLDYAFLPDSYALMFETYDEYKDINEKFKTIYTETKEEIEENTNTKSVDEPFTLLLMGVDTLQNSYNADTLIVVTFNPKTLSTTMVSIPRDTYTTIACTGGKHKINSSGWYGDKCVVSTVGKYLDVNIDYYAKINFTGVVQLVDALGGVTVDVPYAFCEQDSKRRWGKYTVYVEKGIQNLNGEQALALSRNRHYWNGYDEVKMCPSKYSSEGIRNDFQRGKNQQLVLRSLLQKLTSVRDINTIYSLLDTLTDNVTTNMDSNTLFSFYNIGKDLVKRLDNSSIEEVINIKKLAFTSYTPWVRVSGLPLSMVVNYDDSVNAVKNAMKENLGLINKKSTYKLSFDINTPYTDTTIGSNMYGKQSLEVLPNFTKYTLDNAIAYLDSKGIKSNIEYQKMARDSGYSDGEIIEQSIGSYTDLTSINKTVGITLKVVELEKEVVFTYDSCLVNQTTYDNRCYVPDFKEKNISEFDAWVSNISALNIRTSKQSVDANDKDNIIIEQNEFIGKSLYEIYTNNSIIQVKYNKVKVEPLVPDNNTNDDTNTDIEDNKDIENNDTDNDEVNE